MKKELLSYVGGNIRAIRLRRHLSQTELASRLGMRSGPLSCIEKGRNLPSARVLRDLSRALNVSIDSFFTEPLVSETNMIVREPVVAYMSGNQKKMWEFPCALPARTDEELAELPKELCVVVSQLADIFLELEDMSEVSKSAELQLCLAANRTEAGLNQLCSRVRRMLGVNDAVVFDYLELLENVGLRIIFCNLPEKETSISCHDVKNANAFIFLQSEAITPERQLFCLGYELGRLYMHAPDHYKNLVRAQVGRDKRGKPFTPDRAARRFAALFLMPEAAVFATVAQLGIRPNEWTLELLYRIKHRFGVSAQTMVYRLRELNLITSKVEKEFMAEIEKYYKVTNFGEPDFSRRVLTPNGRLWDLFLAAEIRGAAQDDLYRIKTVLEKRGAKKV